MSIILTILTNPFVLAIAGAALGGFAVYKLAFKEITDVFRAFKAAKSKKSAGGTDITAEEWANLGKEAYEAATASWPLVKRMLKAVKLMK